MLIVVVRKLERQDVSSGHPSPQRDGYLSHWRRKKSGGGVRGGGGALGGGGGDGGSGGGRGGCGGGPGAGGLGGDGGGNGLGGGDGGGGGGGDGLGGLGVMSVSGAVELPSESCRRGNCSAVRPNSSAMIRCALRAPSPPPPVMKTASMACGIWSWIEAVSMMT